jgi:hypothetical protein
LREIKISLFIHREPGTLKSGDKRIFMITPELQVERFFPSKLSPGTV